VRPTPGAEAIAEPHEVPLVDRPQHPDHRLLDDLVLQCGDAQGPLAPVGLGNPGPLAGLRSVAAALDAAVKVREAGLQVFAIARPRLPVHAGGRLAPKRVVGVPQQARSDVVEQAGEPQRRVPLCRCTHPVQPTRRGGPARCPVRGRLSRVPLGHRPFLPCLRRRVGRARSPGAGGGLPSPPFRLRSGFTVPPCPRATPLPALFGTFTGTTPMSDFPAAYTSGLQPQAFPDRPPGHQAEGATGISRFSCIEFPRMHRVFDSVGPDPRSRLARRPVWPSRSIKTVGAPKSSVISELNGWPARTPVNASPATSPSPAHDSGPWRLATPSMSGSFIPDSMPVDPGAF
jgi:hypothetical protein